MALEKQLKYELDEQKLFPFAEEVIKEDRRKRRREMWGESIPKWITAISLSVGEAIVLYDFYLKDSVSNFIEYVMQYSPK